MNSVDLDTSKRIYRPRVMHWVFWFIVLVLVPGFVLSITFLLDTDPFAPTIFYSVLITWVVITILALDREILPMRRTFMVVDRRGLSGRSNYFEYEVFWIEIVAANVFGRVRPWLWIATRNRVLHIPLRHLDAKQIWQQITGHLDSQIIGYDAYDNWLDEKGFYEEQSQRNIEIIRTTPVPLRTRQKAFPIVLGWIGLLLFGSCAFCSLSVEAGDLGIIGFIFSVILMMGLGSLAVPNTVEMDMDKVTRLVPLLGRYEIRWDEIKRIEHTPGLEWLVLYGDNKRLPMLGPSRWRKRHREEMWAFLQAQVEQCGIETRVNSSAHLVIFPRNARTR